MWCAWTTWCDRCMARWCASAGEGDWQGTDRVAGGYLSAAGARQTGQLRRDRSESTLHMVDTTITSS